MRFQTNLVGRHVVVKTTLNQVLSGEIVLVRECETNPPLRIALVIRPDTDAELVVVYPGKDKVEVFK